MLSAGNGLNMFPDGGQLESHRRNGHVANSPLTAII